MNVDIQSSIVIHRPRGLVAAYAMNPDNAPRWYSNIHGVSWQTPKEVRVGARVAFAAQFMGRRMVYTYEIVSLAPEEHLVMRASDGPFPMETTYVFEPVAGGDTRMILRNRGNPAGLSR